jgi:hypothetical protein
LLFLKFILVSIIKVHYYKHFCLFVFSLFIILLLKYQTSLYTFLTASIAYDKLKSYTVLIGLLFALYRLIDLGFIIAEYLIKIENSLTSIYIQNTLIISSQIEHSRSLLRIEELNQLFLDLLLSDNN